MVSKHAHGRNRLSSLLLHGPVYPLGRRGLVAGPRSNSTGAALASAHFLGYDTLLTLLDTHPASIRRQKKHLIKPNLMRIVMMVSMLDAQLPSLLGPFRHYIIPAMLNVVGRPD